MTGRLAGKICMITGTGGGIGRASALRFAKEGAIVVGCDIAEQNAADTVELVRASGGEMVSSHPCDLTDPAQCEALMELVRTKYGRLDVLFNNAGSAIFKWIEDLDLSSWNHTIGSELTSAYVLTRAAWPLLKMQGGAIVSTASIAGWRGFKNLGGLAHSAAKAGIIGMSRQWAIEGREYNIRSNTISPGLIESPATKDNLQDPEWRSVMLDRIMRGALGTPDQIASVALFLASEDSSYVNGADIVVDDGMTAW